MASVPLVRRRRGRLRRGRHPAAAMFAGIQPANGVLPPVRCHPGSGPPAASVARSTPFAAPTAPALAPPLAPAGARIPKPAAARRPRARCASSWCVGVQPLPRSVRLGRRSPPFRFSRGGAWAPSWPLFADCCVRGWLPRLPPLTLQRPVIRPLKCGPYGWSGILPTTPDISSLGATHLAPPTACLSARQPPAF